MKVIFSLSLILFILRPTLGQVPQWMNFSTAVQVNEILTEDSLIWAATEGGLVKIDRQNGQRTIYTSINSELPSNNIKQLIIDHNGNLWMSLYAGGVAMFDRQHFTIYFQSPLLGEASYQHYLKVDRNNTIWFNFVNSSSSGRVRIDSLGMHVVSQANYSCGWNSVSASCFDIDTNGAIWSLNGCNGIDKIVNDSVVMTYDASNSPIGTHFWRLNVDHNNIVWVIGAGSNNSQRVYSFNGNVWTTHTSHLSINAAISGKLKIDRNNNKIFYNWGDAVIVYNDTTWTAYSNSPALRTRNVTAVDIDRAGHLFSGTAWSGDSLLYEYDGSSGTTYHVSRTSFPDNYARSVDVDSAGNVYAIFNGAMEKFDGATWTPIPYPPNSCLSNSRVHVDKVGKVWTCGNDNSPPLDVKYYRDSQWTELPLHNSNDMAEDSNGVMYFGGAGLVRYDSSISYPALGSGFGSLGVWDVEIDNYGNFWMCDYNSVARLSGSNLQVFNSSNSPLPNENNVSMEADDSGSIWIPSNTDLYRFDGANWHIYTPANSGLPQPMVFSKILRVNGVLWFATYYKGLVSFDGTHFTVMDEMNKKLGLYINDMVMDRNGTVWFSSEMNGITCYNEHGIGSIAHPHHRVGGDAFLDWNRNGLRDSTDPGMAGQRVLLLPDSMFSHTLSSGTYSFYPDTGDREIVLQPPPGWSVSSDSLSYHVHVDSVDISNLEFGLKADSVFDNFSISLAGTHAGCVPPTTYWLDIFNRGSQIADLLVFFVPDPRAPLLASVRPPDIVSGDTLFWRIDSLMPFAPCNLWLTVQFTVPPVPGDSVHYMAGVYALNHKDSLVAVAQYDEAITCAYDPNDKVAMPAGEGPDHVVDMDVTLDYTIRFQNTGTDTAYTIIIRDTLDPNLEIQSIAFISSSAPCLSYCSSGGILEFRMENVLLPDSNTNYLGSQGYVKLSAKARTGLPDSTIIRNRAFIYFDNNPAIETNTVSRMLVYPPVSVPPVDSNRTQVIIFPNPFEDYFNINAYGKTIMQIDLFDETGRLVLTQNENAVHSSMKTGGLADGIYLVHVTLAGGEVVFKKLVRIQ